MSRSNAKTASRRYDQQKKKKSGIRGVELKWEKIKKRAYPERKKKKIRHNTGTDGGASITSAKGATKKTLGTRAKNDKHDHRAGLGGRGNAWKVLKIDQ